jgi:hypothetical protein
MQIAKHEAASMGNVTMNALYEQMKSACRRVARQIWREHPEMPIDEMLERYEIKEIACQGHPIDRTTLLDWILPELSPHEELPMFREWTVWKIEEAVALWLDVNPFILVQAVQNHRPSFWNAALVPSYREAFSLLLEKAQRAALGGQLVAKEFGNHFWITPRDFYYWAMANTEGPLGSRPVNFFASLQAGWGSDGKDRKETKVEGKIREISRILDNIKAVDPEFNPSSMPGRKQDFHQLCIQLNKPMFSIALSTFSDYLIGVCAFGPGARETDYYVNLAPKLG